MSTVIKNGTIVTADRTFKADVLIEDEKIAAIGPDLHGDHDSTRPAAMSCPAASIRIRISKCPSWAPTRPTISRAARGRRCRAAPRWWSISCLPGQGQALLDALQMWHNKTGRATCDYSYHMAITWWGEKVFDEMAEVVEARHQHLQALHGLQGRADGERRRDVRLVPALRRARRAAAGPCRERRRGGRAAGEATGRGQYRPGGACLFAPAGGRGRGDQPRDHDRRHGGRAALCRAYLVRAGA